MTLEINVKDTVIMGSTKEEKNIPSPEIVLVYISPYFSKVELAWTPCLARSPANNKTGVTLSAAF